MRETVPARLSMLRRTLLLLLPAKLAGFGSLQYLSNPYVHRPATEITTYNAGSYSQGDSGQVPLPLQFGGGELEVISQGNEVLVRQTVLSPPPSPRLPPPPSPAPPPPFEKFADGVCTGCGCECMRAHARRPTGRPGSALA